MRLSQPILTVALAVVAVAGTFSSVSADEIELRRLFHGPERCDHVMSLLLRHGVNNDAPVAATMPGLHPLGGVHIPAADIGDMQIVSVHRHDATVAGCGPSFDIAIKNCSARDICGSRITLVGLLGRILPISPNTTLQIESLPAGQVMQVTVTLPIESLSMGNYNGAPVGMNRLLVVIDSFDQFLETNEANNLRLFDLAAIPVAVAAVATETTVEETTTVAPAATAAPAATQAAPAVTAPATPAQTTAPAPADTNSSITSTDLQSAIDQFSDSTDDAAATADAS